MTSHEWFLEQRTAYVTRSLAADEERSFREHLDGCPACREAVAAEERALEWLAMGVRPVAPRPGLTRQLVDGATGRVRRRTGWPVPVALAASLLVAVGSVLWARAEVRRVTEASSRRQAAVAAELAGVRDTLGILRGASEVRHASITMGEHTGGMMIFADTRSHRWNVVVYGLPAPHPGEVCQFWFITADGMVRSVALAPSMNAPALVTLEMPPGGGQVMGGALTVEPAGTQGAAPRGKELAHLML